MVHFVFFMSVVRICYLGTALGFIWREWCWSWNSSTLATSCEELTHWKTLWCWEGWGQEGKGTTEDEMAGWHQWLNGCESEWTPGDDDGQGSLACFDSWGHKESDTTERLNWTELKFYLILWELNKTIVKNISRDHQRWNNLEVASQVRPKTRSMFHRKINNNNNTTVWFQSKRTRRTIHGK